MEPKVCSLPQERRDKIHLSAAATSFLSKQHEQNVRAKQSHTDIEKTHGTANLTMKATVASFIPRAHIPCAYFPLGTCQYGTNCRYFHDTSTLVTDDGITASEDEELSEELKKLELDETQANLKFESDDDASCTRDFGGAGVTFGAGAAVSTIKLPSDVSMIQMMGLPLDARLDVPANFLKVLGFEVPLESINVNKSPTGAGCIATIKFGNSKTAKLVVDKFEKDIGPARRGALSVKEIFPGSDFGKWIQMGSVTCSWFKPTRMAFLTHIDPGVLNGAANTLLTARTPAGRRLACRLKEPSTRDHLNRFTLEVRNLEPECSTDWFEDILSEEHKPLNIKLGKPAHEISEDDSQALVEGLLRSIGPLETSSFYKDPSSAKLKINATYFDAKHAIKAVEDLNREVEEVGDLDVKPFVSLKFMIPNRIVEAIRKDLEKLKKQSREEDGVVFSLPNATRTNKKYSSRLWISALGADAPKLVAKAKIELEKLLAGNVVQNDVGPLWHSFFAKSQALHYLSGVSRTNNVYVHRDIRHCRLVLYGGSQTSREDAWRALVSKVAELSRQRQTIMLKPEQLKSLIAGGFSKLESTFGERVTLDISSSPKRIILHGNKEEASRARSLLPVNANDKNVSPTRPSPTSPGTCCVCWTVATDPLKTICSHVYCRECFLHQVESAGEHEIPIGCHGDEDKCTQIFSIKELQTLLPFASFEALLETSFKSHIRVHPQDYQYCPTPDCSSVYRINASTSDSSEADRTFFCTTCLARICTSCKVLAHEGMDCREYLDSLNTEVNQQLKLDEGIKDCPRCSTLLYKYDGCNHIECGGCKTHICWVCMKTFPESGLCYAHMDAAHGGNGLDDFDAHAHYDSDSDDEEIPVPILGRPNFRALGHDLEGPH